MDALQLKLKIPKEDADLKHALIQLVTITNNRKGYGKLTP